MKKISIEETQGYMKYFNSQFSREEGCIRRVKYPVNYSLGNRVVNMKSLADIDIHKGLKAYYFDYDDNAARQWFYLSAKLLAETCKYSNGWDMRSPDRFIFALLSDNAELIHIYSHLDTLNNTVFHPNQRPPLKECYELPKEGRFYILLLQHLLRRDWETIDTMWQTYQQKIKKPHIYQADNFSFYFALRDGDTTAMKNIILHWLKPRAHRDYNKYLTLEFNGEFWSHRPTVFTKLAMMFGYELDIEHDLIPAKLIPVKPLEVYDDVYDFFKPGFDWEAGLRKRSALFSFLFGRNR